MIRITTHNIDVLIYKNKGCMRRKLRSIGYSVDHTEAMVTPITVYSYKSGKKIVSPIIAELYLHEDATMPVVVHETLHAATTVMRAEKESMNLSKGIRTQEEILAYTQTAILQDVLKVFFPKKNSDYKFEGFKDLKSWASGSRKASKK